MTFEEWYRKYWWYGSSTDRKKAQSAWLAAKDFNTINLQDLEYICETAASKFIMLKEPGWAERAQKYREKLHELVRENP